jgi:hypothetical protein
VSVCRMKLVIVVILCSLQQGLPSNSLGASVFGPVPDVAPETDPLEFTATDMSLSTLYLHELHHRQVSGKFLCLCFLLVLSGLDQQRGTPSSVGPGISFDFVASAIWVNDVDKLFMDPVGLGVSILYIC